MPDSRSHGEASLLVHGRARAQPSPRASTAARANTLVPFIAAGCLLLFAPLLFQLATGRMVAFNDSTPYSIPVRYVYREALRSGASILWTRSLYAGLYLHADGQVGMFHPLHLLLYWLLPLAAAFNLEIIGGHVAALAGMWLLLRRAGLSFQGALFGAMTFAFSGYNLLHVQVPNFVAVIAHTPWLLLASDVILRSGDGRRRAWGFAGLGACVASETLLGHPQAMSITFVAVAGLTLFRVARGAAFSRSILIAGGIVCGMLLGCVQLVPTLDALRASVRAAPSMEYRLWGSLPPINLLQLWSPAAFRGYAYPDGFVDYSLYNGAFGTLALAWITLRWRTLARQRFVCALLACAAVSLWLALGRFGFLYRALASFPAFNAFRAPSRYLALFEFALSAIAAIVFDDIAAVARGASSIDRRRLWIVGAPAALGVLTTAVTVSLSTSTWATAHNFLSGVRHAGPPIAVALAMAGLVVLAVRGKRWCLPALVLLVAADQGTYGYLYVYSSNPPISVEELAAAAPVPTGAKPDEVLSMDSPGSDRDEDASAVLAGFRVVPIAVGLHPRLTLPLNNRTVQRIAGVNWAGTPAGWEKVASTMPRARLVAQALPSADIARDVSTIDISRVALVEHLRNPLTGEPGSARVIVDRSGDLEVETTAGGSQLLVLTERFHEGWRVTEDGHSGETARVYGDYLGAYVQRGTHRTVFAFKPKSLRDGLRLSLVGLVLLLSTTAILWRRATGRAESAISNPGLERRAHQRND